MEIFENVAAWCFCIDLVLLIIFGILMFRNTIRYKRVDRSHKKVKKELEKEFAKLSCFKAYDCGLRKNYSLGQLRNLQYIDELVYALERTGCKLELVPAVEASTNSIEVSGITNEEFQEELKKVYLKCYGKFLTIDEDDEDIYF